MTRSTCGAYCVPGVRANPKHVTDTFHIDKLQLKFTSLGKVIVLNEGTLTMSLNEIQGLFM